MKYLGWNVTSAVCSQKIMYSSRESRSGRIHHGEYIKRKRVHFTILSLFCRISVFQTIKLGGEYN